MTAPADADAELITLCDQFADLENRLHAAADCPDDAAYDRLSNEVRGPAEALLDQFCDIPAQTFAGIVAKARAVAAYDPGIVGGQAAWSEHIVSSILRDLLGVAS